MTNKPRIKAKQVNAFQKGRQAAQQGIPLTDTDYLLKQTNDVVAYWSALAEFVFQKMQKRDYREGRSERDD